MNKTTVKRTLCFNGIKGLLDSPMIAAHKILKGSFERVNKNGVSYWELTLVHR